MRRDDTSGGVSVGCVGAEGGDGTGASVGAGAGEWGGLERARSAGGRGR